MPYLQYHIFENQPLSFHNRCIIPFYHSNCFYLHAEHSHQISKLRRVFDLLNSLHHLRIHHLAQSPETSHLAYGIPGKADTIVERPGYALGYIERHEQAAWVIYIISNKQILAKNAERSNHSFRRDPAIPTGSASSSDYTRSGFDRGHLAPAADMAYSEQTMRDSFYMSNISPQRPGFNRGIWKDLEAWVRQTAVKERLVVVVTGPVFPGRDIQLAKMQLQSPRIFIRLYMI